MIFNGRSWFNEEIILYKFPIRYHLLLRYVNSKVITISLRVPPQHESIVLDSTSDESDFFVSSYPSSQFIILINFQSSRQKIKFVSRRQRHGERSSRRCRSKHGKFRHGQRRRCHLTQQRFNAGLTFARNSKRHLLVFLLFFFHH